jgi:hypothetical protein
MLPLTEPELLDSVKRPIGILKNIPESCENDVSVFNRKICPIVAPLAAGRNNKHGGVV